MDRRRKAGVIGRFTVPALLALFLVSIPNGLLGREETSRPAGRFRAAFGLDSLERKYYQPEFRLSAPLGGPGRNRLFLDLSYLQKINGDMEGPIDFWVRAGWSAPLTPSILPRLVYH